jgi:hypothetical protein
MPRKPRDQLFKKSDVYRLVEAARAKNLRVARIVVTREGLSLVVGEATPTPDTDKAGGVLSGLPSSQIGAR